MKITLFKRCHHKPSGDIIFHVINNKLHNVFYLVVSCNSNAYLFTNQYESRANKLIEMYSNYFNNWNTNICFEFDQQMRVVCVLAREKKICKRLLHRWSVFLWDAPSKRWINDLFRVNSFITRRQCYSWSALVLSS